MESNNHDFNDLGMKNRLDDSKSRSKQSKHGRAIAFAVSLMVLILVIWFVRQGASKKQGKQIEIDNNRIGTTDGKYDANGNPQTPASRSYQGSVKKEYPLANVGDVSPISGLACDNWNRRPMAVMIPTDPRVRPLAGISKADMVFEMPVLVDGKPRLMAVYVCETPQEVGPIRSSRHDFLSLAKGLDAIYAHWGGSQFAKEKLKLGLIENINGNNDGGQSANQCFFIRKDLTSVVEDQKRANVNDLYKCASDFGYSLENHFSGYAHQGEAPSEDRINKGILKIGMDSSTGNYYVEYEYDKGTNSFLRTWGGVADVDRDNGTRIAPKNVVVLTASQEIMIDDNNTPYNNVQLGDPWYDDADKGDAYYYINGREIRGTWSKDKSRMDSKLIFKDDSGQEIKFVPGQIWVEVLEPGRSLKWKIEE